MRNKLEIRYLFLLEKQGKLGEMEVDVQHRLRQIKMLKKR